MAFPPARRSPRPERSSGVTPSAWRSSSSTPWLRALLPQHLSTRRSACGTSKPRVLCRCRSRLPHGILLTPFVSPLPLLSMRPSAAEKLSGAFPDSIFSFDWNYDGSLIAVTTKDKKLRVFDPRSSTIVKVVPRLPSLQVLPQAILTLLPRCCCCCCWAHVAKRKGTTTKG